MSEPNIQPPLSYHHSVAEKTGDGSTTLFSETFRQPYHNRAGAASESRYLFLEMTGLVNHLKDGMRKPVTIFETGFGTGLNLAVLMELLMMPHNAEVAVIHYYSIEGFPPAPSVMEEMQYGLDPALPENSLHPAERLKNIFTELSGGWNHITIHPQLHLHLLIGTFEEFAEQDSWSSEIRPVNLFFHDPFSPETNPAGWSVSLFKRLRNLAAEDALLSTYSASTAARAAMAMAGWRVARAPGALNKREMTLASVQQDRLSHLKRVNEQRLKERFERGDFISPSPITPPLREHTPPHPSPMNQPFDSLARHLQPFYSRFDVANRLLFTGHSHQAWPDAAFDGIREYEVTAAHEVDKKWGVAAEKTEILREYLRHFYDDSDGRWCREQNTHVLMVSWLSSLDLVNKPVILTTTGEFHSMSRQLRSLAKRGVNVVTLDHRDDDRLLQAIKSHIGDDCAAVMLSRIYFQTAEVQTRLSEIADVCRRAGVPLMIDDYHGTNVIPLSLKEANLEDCYLLIGGYKYLQWGEANCFLRFPRNCTLMPVITGWFAAFDTLDQPKNPQKIDFDDGDQKFATATYDPVSQFRAAAVVKFFHQQGLTPDVLQAQYCSQVSYLTDLFEEMNREEFGLMRSHNRPPEQTGGFLSLRSAIARDIRAALLQQGIFTDARHDILRIGPAPYVTSDQCEQMMKRLFETCGDILQAKKKL